MEFVDDSEFSDAIFGDLFSSFDDTQSNVDPEFIKKTINELIDKPSPESPDDSEYIKQQENLFKEARQEAIRQNLYYIPERVVQIKIKKTKKQLSNCDALIINLKNIFLQAKDFFEKGQDINFWNYTNYFISAILDDGILTLLNNCTNCLVTDYKKIEHVYTKLFKKIKEKNIEIKDFFLLNKPLLTAKINQNFEYANDNLKKLLTIFLLFLQIKVIYRDFEFPNSEVKIENYEENDVQEHSYITFSQKIENNREISFQLVLNLLKNFIPEWVSKSKELAKAFKDNSKNFIQKVLELKGKLPPPPILPKIPKFEPGDNRILSETLPNYPQTKEERLQIIEQMTKLNIPINNRNMEIFINKNKDSDINRCIAIWNPQQKKGESRPRKKRCELKNVFIKMKLSDYNYSKQFFYDTFGETIDMAEINKEFTVCNKHIKKIFGIRFIKNQDQKTFTATAKKEFLAGETICRDGHLEIGSLIQVSLENSNLKYTDNNYLVTTKDIKKGDVLRKPERPISQKGAIVSKEQQEAYDKIYNKIKTVQENRHSMLEEKRWFTEKQKNKEEEIKLNKSQIAKKEKKSRAQSIKSLPPTPSPPPPPPIPSPPPPPQKQYKKIINMPQF